MVGIPKREGRWRKWGVGAGLCVALLVGLFFLFPAGDGYKVDGVPFRQWVAAKPDWNIVDPLAAVGTNALPSMERILRESTGSPNVYHAKMWVWIHLPRMIQARCYRLYPVSEAQLKRTVLFGLRYLGPEAKPALADVLQVTRTETNTMLRAVALVAALQIAPERPEVFEAWRNEWDRTNGISRNDLALYLAGARAPIAAAVPLLVTEMKEHRGSQNVIQAFTYMGEAARPAIPYLAEAARDPGRRGDVLDDFCQLGPVAADATPMLVEILGLGDSSMARTLEALKAIGPGASNALPAIDAILRDEVPTNANQKAQLIENYDSTIHMLAACAKARVENKPEAALPVLMDVLNERVKGSERELRSLKNNFSMPGKSYVTMDERIEVRSEGGGAMAACMLAGELGPGASDLLPEIEKRLTDKNKFTRVAAAEAVWRISGKTEKALPVLVAILNEEAPDKGGGGNWGPLKRYISQRAVETLGEMGPQAKEAIPAMERVKTFSMNLRRAVIEAEGKIEANEKAK